MRCGEGLESYRQHKPIANSNNHNKRDDRRRDTACQEVLNFKVSLSGVLVFHHNGSYR